MPSEKEKDAAVMKADGPMYAKVIRLESKTIEATGHDLMKED